MNRRSSTSRSLSVRVPRKRGDEPVRHDFGAGVVDWVGAQYNAG